MNTVHLLGRLTATPELKTTPSAVAMTTATIAVNRKFIPKGGERQTDFFHLVAWRHNAEFLCKYFAKGQQLAVTGSLQNRDWTDKEGVKHYITEVMVDEIYFADSKKEGSKTAPDSAGDYGAPMPVYAFTDSNFTEISEDGQLPF